MGFKPMTSAIPVQCSTNWANNPTGYWSPCSLLQRLLSISYHVLLHRCITLKKWKKNKLVLLIILNLKLSRSGCKFSFPAATHFLVISCGNLLLDQEKQFLPDKFEYSFYLFAGYCMDIVGRSYMLIASGSQRVNDVMILILVELQFLLILMMRSY